MEEKGEVEEVGAKIIYKDSIKGIELKQRFAGDFYEAQEGFLFN